MMLTSQAEDQNFSRLNCPYDVVPPTGCTSQLDEEQETCVNLVCDIGMTVVNLINKSVASKSLCGKVCRDRNLIQQAVFRRLNDSCVNSCD